MDLLAVARTAITELARFYTEAGPGEEAAGFQINLFWVATQAATILIFLLILYLVAFRRIGGVLEERRTRIEQGLRDADAARREREQAAEERQRVLGEARREASDIVARAQRVAEESRDREVAETRSEIERLREQAVVEIDSERQRALADVRGQVADLALLAAGKVVGETMNEPRERRLVDEFLAQVGSTPADGSGRRAPA